MLSTFLINKNIKMLPTTIIKLLQKIYNKYIKLVDFEYILCTYCLCMCIGISVFFCQLKIFIINLLHTQRIIIKERIEKTFQYIILLISQINFYFFVIFLKC